MDFQTPQWICERMVQMIPSHAVTVLEPTPGEGNLVRALAGYKVTAPDDFFTTTGRYDAVVMNPPFSPMRQGYEILYAVMEMSDTIIALMPWLTIINSEHRTRDIFSYGLKQISHLPRTAFKGARVQTCILEMSKGWIGDTIFRDINRA
jgi:hypothetical protein